MKNSGELERGFLVNAGVYAILELVPKGMIFEFHWRDARAPTAAANYSRFTAEEFRNY